MHVKMIEKINYPKCFLFSQSLELAKNMNRFLGSLNFAGKVLAEKALSAKQEFYR